MKMLLKINFATSLMAKCEEQLVLPSLQGTKQSRYFGLGNEAFRHESETLRHESKALRHESETRRHESKALRHESEALRHESETLGLENRAFSPTPVIFLTIAFIFFLMFKVFFLISLRERYKKKQRKGALSFGKCSDYLFVSKKIGDFFLGNK